MKLKIDEKGVPIPIIAFVCTHCNSVNAQHIDSRIVCGECNSIWYQPYDGFGANSYQHNEKVK